ncbi:hypothetical protein ACFV84_01455, partial [Kitasatospora sp. NPDC059811]|uniref:hypothetical protein n=1 Tax=Kitasatospora sp. NPDC059811 TaxID=3346957 RepID=UPI003655D495
MALCGDGLNHVVADDFGPRAHAVGADRGPVLADYLRAAERAAELAVELAAAVVGRAMDEPPGRRGGGRPRRRGAGGGAPAAGSSAA